MLLSSLAVVGMVGSLFAGGLELVLLVSSSIGGSKFMLLGSSGVCGMLVIVCIVLGKGGRAVLFVLNMLHVGADRGGNLSMKSGMLSILKCCRRVFMVGVMSCCLVIGSISSIPRSSRRVFMSGRLSGNGSV